MKTQIGEKFGRLTVLEVFRLEGTTRAFCRCECGNERTVHANNLRRGLTKSCGCVTRERMTKHGDYQTPTYKVWSAMKHRCYNPDDPQYADYGGRGIKVCERWRNDFVAYRDDIGPKPEPHLTLDRINNDGDYEPGNVRWATRKQQQNNRRPDRTPTLFRDINDRRISVQKIADFLAIDDSVLRRHFVRAGVL